MKTIKNLKVSKTDTYIAGQWLAINAEKHRLLSMSEWSQSQDNVLTFESYVLWSDWRSKLRDITPETFYTPEEAKTRLDELLNQKPFEDTTSIHMRQKKYSLDISSIESAKRDAKKILKKFVSEYLEDHLPENIHFITLKYQSLNEWSKSGVETFEHFPLLTMHMKINGLDLEATIDSIHTLHKLAVDEASKLEDLRFDYNDQIDHAEIPQQIINIVKRMHGY